MVNIVFTGEEKKAFKKIKLVLNQCLKEIEENKNKNYNLKKIDNINHLTNLLKINIELFESNNFIDRDIRNNINKIITKINGFKFKNISNQKEKKELSTTLHFN